MSSSFTVNTKNIIPNERDQKVDCNRVYDDKKRFDLQASKPVTLIGEIVKPKQEQSIMKVQHHGEKSVLNVMVSDSQDHANDESEFLLSKDIISSVCPRNEETKHVSFVHDLRERNTLCQSPIAATKKMEEFKSRPRILRSSLPILKNDDNEAQDTTPSQRLLEPNEIENNDNNNINRVGAMRRLSRFLSSLMGCLSMKRTSSVESQRTPQTSSSIQSPINENNNIESSTDIILSVKNCQNDELNQSVDLSVSQNQRLQSVSCVQEVAGEVKRKPLALLPQAITPHRKTLVLDLDETLVHSTFRPISDPDIVVDVEVAQSIHKAYVRVRPDVEEFLEQASSMFDVVVFTASVSAYADPVISWIDRNNTISFRLFRQHCVWDGEFFIKDLTHLGRPLDSIVIVDNSPRSYERQPANAIAVASWFENSCDHELHELLPLLRILYNTESVFDVLHPNKHWRISLAEHMTADISELESIALTIGETAQNKETNGEEMRQKLQTESLDDDKLHSDASVDDKKDTESIQASVSREQKR